MIHGYGVICFVIGAMLLFRHLNAGFDRERTLRCTACGSRAGEKHHRDCHYKDKF